MSSNSSPNRRWSRLLLRPTPKQDEHQIRINSQAVKRSKTTQDAKFEHRFNLRRESRSRIRPWPNRRNSLRSGVPVNEVVVRRSANVSADLMHSRRKRTQAVSTCRQDNKALVRKTITMPKGVGKRVTAESKRSKTNFSLRLSSREIQNRPKSIPKILPSRVSRGKTAASQRAASHVRTDSGARKATSCRNNVKVLTQTSRVLPNPGTGVETRMRSSKMNLDNVLSPRNRIVVNGRQYQVLSRVGRGGSSQVFKVLSSECKILALKRVEVSPLNRVALKGYSNEISFLQTLIGESAIVKLFDSEVCTKTGVIHMILELGEMDMAKLLRRGQGRPLHHDELRSYWRQMLSAVSAIHRSKIVHGDLKPANFVLVSGVLKLIDFGIAKAITTDDTTKVVRDCVAGTPNYMSPEALCDIEQEEHNGQRGYRVSRASDIWSLGCILYQMAHGKTPFAHIRDTFRKTHRIKDPAYDITFPHTGNIHLDNVLRGCLQRDPLKRFSIPQLQSHPLLADRESCSAVAVDVLGRIKQEGVVLSNADNGIQLSDIKAQQVIKKCVPVIYS